MVTKDEVVKIAKLAKLSFTEPELDALTGELNAILGHIDQLKEVDVTGIEPLENINEAVETNVFRTDTPRPSLTREEALKNAPQSADGYFLVPKVLEQETKPIAVTQLLDEENEEDIY
jgi:aspartyl-tRNA(Asn)/glutamyl-tRNA(Gln) amidotransferase subunit C